MVEGSEHYSIWIGGTFHPDQCYLTLIRCFIRSSSPGNSICPINDLMSRGAHAVDIGWIQLHWWRYQRHEQRFADLHLVPIQRPAGWWAEHRRSMVAQHCRWLRPSSVGQFGQSPSVLTSHHQVFDICKPSGALGLRPSRRPDGVCHLWCGGCSHGCRKSAGLRSIDSKRVGRLTAIRIERDICSRFPRRDFRLIPRRACRQ